MRGRGTILIVDDSSDIRRFISQVLEAEGYACREAPTGEAALELVRRDPPSLVVLDVHLPGISGYEVCRKLREEFGEAVPILFVSGERVESFDRVAGMIIGGDDYLTKPFAPDELVARVRSLARRSFGGPRLTASKLTPREQEVLRLLAFGMSHNEIADRLVLSPKTISTHIEHIFLKLGVQSRAQAVAAAYRDDLIDLDAPMVVEIASRTTAPPAIASRPAKVVSQRVPKPRTLTTEPETGALVSAPQPLTAADVDDADAGRDPRPLN